MSTIKFENCPSTNTPLNADNLNKLNYRPKGGGLILNGNFDLWQRGTSFSVSADTYTADRWISLGNNTTSQQTDVPTINGAKYSLNMTGTGVNLSLYQKIKNENNILYDKKSTVSFYVKGSQAISNAGIRLVNRTQAIQIDVQTYDITTSWNKIEVTFTNSTNWNNDDLIEVYILNDTNVVNSQYVRFSQVKFEVGEVATDFEPKTVEEVEKDCFDYYYRLGEFSNERFYTGISTTTTEALFDIADIIKRMIQTPTMGYSQVDMIRDGVASYVISSMSISNNTLSVITTGMGQGQLIQLRTNAVGGYLEFNSEL